MKLIFGCDHAGFDMKQELMELGRALGHDVTDVGAFSGAEPVDYPDIADLLVAQLNENPDAMGCLICGTGIGMSIAANRFDFIRAAVCNGAVASAQLARAHNNANVICFGARLIDTDAAKACFKVFLETPFEGGRHATRVEKLTKNK